MNPENSIQGVVLGSFAVGGTASAALALAAPAWDPLLVGALIGVLTWAMFLFLDAPLGVSSAYAKIAGLIGRAVAPGHIEGLKYYREKSPRVDWEVMLAIGVVAGGFLAAWTGEELAVRWLPPLWVERFGSDSFGLRAATALMGGALMAYGARLAGGCTSGHGISGTLQLSVGSWIALIAFFAGGVPVALLLIGR